MSQSYRIEGIVIKRIRYKDHDRIITLLTRELGKISVIAKGVRKSSSKRLGHVELFNQIEAVVYKGKGLDILGETSLKTFFSLPDLNHKNKLSKIISAYQLTELVDAFLPENQANEQIYDWLVESFNHLHIKQHSTQLTDAFKLRLLQNLGYWPLSENAPVNIDHFVESLLEKPLKTNYLFDII